MIKSQFRQKKANKSKNTEQGLDNNEDTSMDWTTVRPKGKRTRSNSNDSEKINVELQVSPNKKQKSTETKLNWLPEMIILEIGNSLIRTGF